MGGGSWIKGKRAAEQGLVRDPTWDPAVSELRGRVRDRGRYHRARASFSIDTAGTARFAGSECDCTLRRDCKHVAALVQAAFPPQADPAAGRPTDSQPPEPASAAAPMALELWLEAGLGCQHRLFARIIRHDRSGEYDRLTFGNLPDATSLGEYDQAQLHAVRALLQLYRESGGGVIRDFDRSIDLSGIRSPRLWTLLEEAAAAGVQLQYPGTAGPLPPLGEGRFYVDVTRNLDAELCLGAVILNSDRESFAPVSFLGADGLVAVCVSRAERAADVPANWRFRLIRLVKSVDWHYRQWGLAGECQQVPADQEAVFLKKYYAGLRWGDMISSDDSVRLPTISGPDLVLRVCTESNTTLEVTWEWAYQIGDLPRRVPLRPGSEEEYYRNVNTERQVMAGLDLPLRRYRLGAHVRGRAILAPRTLLRDQEAMQFLRELPRLRDQPRLIVETGSAATTYREATGPLLITLATDQVTGRTDWFGLEVTVTIEGHDVPFVDLFVALSRHDKYLMLPDGTFFSLDRPELNKLAQLIEEARALNEPGPLQVNRHQIGLLNELAALGASDDEMLAWRNRSGGLITPETTSQPVPATIKKELYPHQKDGFDWLAGLWERQTGGILADEMGLGKTLQSLALIAHARDRDPTAAPWLIVTLSSVADNWVDEANSSTGLRLRGVKRITKGRRQTLEELASGCDAVVTTYDLLRLDFEAYQAMNWSGMLLDEAQRIKNVKSAVHLCARRLRAPVKIATTGTPMENNLMELWALLSVVVPGLFPRSDGFFRYFAQPIEDLNDDGRREQLWRRIRPTVLLRTKEHTLPELPPKHEQLLKVELHEQQREVYQRQLHREQLKVLNLLDDMNTHRFTILRSLTRLRQLSLHAGLVDEACADLPSAKIDALMSQLGEMGDSGHRALVFSQFTRFLGKIGERLEAEGVPYCQLDGSTRDRAGIISKFKSGTAPVFLISLTAGGAGLNLTEADHCFLLDPWWNPAVEAQAVDRAHRIGQRRPVSVCRMVAADTVEEGVIELSDRKARLCASILRDSRRPLDARLTADDIRALYTHNWDELAS
jgi:superfamily II DNA or RNA helicase